MSDAHGAAGCYSKALQGRLQQNRKAEALLKLFTASETAPKLKQIFLNTKSPCQSMLTEKKIDVQILFPALSFTEAWLLCKKKYG